MSTLHFEVADVGSFARVAAKAMVYALGKEFWALLFNFVSSVLIIIINSE